MTATAIGSYATSAELKRRLFPAGSTDTTDDTLLGLVCDQVNAYIEAKTRRPICPVSSATFLLDGNGQRYFCFPRGVRAITDLSVGDYTGGPRITLDATSYFLRPHDHERVQGFPATEVWLSEYAARTVFPVGFDTISMTATTGWAAIPDEIIDVALTAATRAWHAVQSGQSDVVGTDAMGAPVVSRFFSARDLETLRLYSTDLPG